MRFPAAAPDRVPRTTTAPTDRPQRQGDATTWGAIEARPHPAASATAPLRWGVVAACALALAGCATAPSTVPGRTAGGRYFDPILGVWASPRVVEDGQAVPHGGGGYLVGRPYTIGGHVYAPIANPAGYVAVGTASWYGDAFHGRRTANGEVFDKGSISAAHPTLPLPSYVRVTNLKNGRSMIVRVNDRGPYHGGRVMDVSQRVAEALAFRNEGTGHIRIEYVGRASLAGSDDEKLLATLTTDGRPARLDGMAEPSVAADETLPPPPDGPSPLPNVPARIAALPLFRREPPPPRPVAAALPTAAAAPPSPRTLAAPTARVLLAPAPRISAAPARSASPLPAPRAAAVVRRGAPDPFFRPLVAPARPPVPAHRPPMPRRPPARPRPAGDDAAQ